MLTPKSGIGCQTPLGILAPCRNATDGAFCVTRREAWATGFDCGAGILLCGRHPTGPVAHASIWLAAQLRPAQKSGMIARLQEHRPSGVEDLNALIDAPLNRALVRQVQEIERGQREISPANLAELS